jgi:hypothetical protein
MKHITKILFFILLTSCGGHPKENTDYKKIIGNPIKITDNGFELEITQYDFPFKMDWNEADQACTAMGDGWRMPTVDELSLIFKYEDRVPEFRKENIYWSKSETEFENMVWMSGYKIGDMRTKKSDRNTFRAVRAKGDSK